MNKRYIRLFGAGHLVTDIYQGALPALLPFLISERKISYAAAALLIFAANASSSIIQPVFGIFSDKISAPWALGVGVGLSGLGIGLTGLTQNYNIMFLLVALSGIGIALYHPEGARLANKYAGKFKTSAISIFSAGGNIGFAVGPIITTSIILLVGLKGTMIICIPALIMSIIFLSQAHNFSKPYIVETEKTPNQVPEIKLADEWKPFFRLILTLLCRAVIFFGFNTFLTLYWMKDLHQSELKGSIALSILIIVGATGTLFAGKLADSIGNKKIILIGYSCLFPLIILFLSVKNPIIASIILVPLGFALYAPFSPMVALGQKYLPNHVGLASGITLGLAVTMGGVVSPILGLISDHYGIHAALSGLIVIPIFAVLLARKLPTPRVDLISKATEEDALSS